jgi:drug/metabolite transporter (DMT)-like permease
MKLGHPRLLLAFATVYIIWGSTYLVKALLIPVVPPLLLTGLRFLCAAALLLPLALLPGMRWSGPRKSGTAVALGMLFQGIGSGGSVWALKYVPSGMEALIIATQPLVVIVMVWLLHKDRPRKEVLLGCLLGMAGATLLVLGSDWQSRPGMWLGLVVTFISLVSWAWASLLLPKLNLPENPLELLGFQMLGGGLFCVILEWVLQGALQVSWSQIHVETLLGFGYLVIFGAVATNLAYNYLLRNTTATMATTYSYVNPVIALLLGWIFLNEPLGWTTLTAAVILLAGVGLVMQYGMQKH